jgi:hypothetical protein
VIERTGSHLDPETIAALVDGTLAPEARAAADAHIAVCADCREVWVETSEIAAETRGATTTSETSRDVAVMPRRGSRRSWIYGAAGLAAAAAIAFAVLSPRMFTRASDLQRLVDAVGENRRTEARLTGGFRWGAVPNVTRGERDAAPVPSSVQIEIARLQQAMEQNRTPRSVAAFGSAAAIGGRLDDAVAAFEEVTAGSEAGALAWSDLAAAYLERARLQGNAIDVPRALQAAETAVKIDPSLVEAHFNRAVALERHGLRPEAIDAWREYLEREKDPRWRQEAAERIRRLESAGQSGAPISDAQTGRDRLMDELLPRWAAEGNPSRAQGIMAEAKVLAGEISSRSTDAYARDVLAAAEARQTDRRLREGHAAYGAARQFYRRADFEGALSGFDRARTLLTESRSPLGIQADLYAGIVLYQQSRLADAKQRLTRVVASIGEKPYFSPRGRAQWMLGATAALDGSFFSALQHYEDARESLRRAAEPANAAVVESVVAWTLDQIGDASRAWTTRLRVLQETSREGVLLSAAEAASRMRWFEVAATLQDAAARRARQTNHFPNLSDALRARALTDAKRQDWDSARRHVKDAHDAAERASGTARQARLAEVALAEAQIVTNGDIARGFDALTSAEAYLSKPGNSSRLPELHAGRARLLRLAGRYAEARRELERGLTIHDAERDRLPAGMQLTYADVLRRLGEELVTLEISAGATDRAAAAVDWLKGRDLTHGRSLAFGRLSPPGDGRTALLYFVTSDALFAWCINSRETGFHRTNIGSRVLASLVREAGWPSFSNNARQTLYTHLLAPFDATLRRAPVRSLVIVADGPLHGLNFATLTRDTEPLITEYTISVSPSLSAASDTAPQARAARTRVMALGNPLIDRRAYPALPSLPDAETEAGEVARSYARAESLIGESATAPALLRGLRTAEVVHFAGHAVINEIDPDQSALVLPNGTEPSLAVRDVRRITGARSGLLVLAACRGTSGTATASEGPISLARAFMVIGIPRVLANQWPAGDRSARTLLGHFHEEYAKGTDAAEALRIAQLSLLRSNDLDLRSPAAWAGFVLIEAAGIDATNRRDSWH